MQMKRLALFLAGVMILTVALAGCGSKPASSGTIKIGVEGPLTGQYALEGQGFLNAINLLAEQLNKAGGVNGSQVQIVSADDKGDPKEASLAAQKLVNEKVVAVVGAYNSTATEAAQSTYDEAKILMITPSSTNVTLSQKGLKLFFRTASLDDAQGQYAGQYLVKTLGKKNIAIIHDNTTYGKGLAEESKKGVEANGGKVVFFDAITPGDKDFNAVLTKIKSTNPDGIYFTGYYSDGGLLLKQARDLGITAVFMAGDANNNPGFVQAAGNAAAKGALVTTPPQPQDLQDPAAQQFMKDFKAKYNQDAPSTWTMAAADAFRVVVEAIKQTKSTDSTKLADYMHTGMKNFSGFTGSISFDAKGDRVGVMHRVYQVDDKGAFVLAK